MSEEQAGSNGFLSGLVWGVFLGIAAFVFFETEKGKKIKERLKEEGDDLLEELPEIIDRLEEKGEEFVAQVSKLEKDVEEKASEVKADLTTDVGEKLDSSLGHIEALQEHGREITAGVRRRLFKNIPKKRPLSN